MVRKYRIFHNSQNLPSFLAVPFQKNCRFSVQSVNAKNADHRNKCLCILRILTKEGYNQLEMDKLFISLVRAAQVVGLREFWGPPPPPGGVGLWEFKPPPPPLFRMVKYINIYFLLWLPRSVTYHTNKV